LSKEIEEFYIKLRDAAALILDGANAVLEALGPPEGRQSAAYDVSKIKWEGAQGAKGAYEKSDDVNNPHHKALLQDLASHKGKMSAHGFFLWTFENGTTIGRKKVTG
jgi:hypothetical protein